MKKGLFGGLSGKLGPACMYTSRGQEIVRALPGKRVTKSQKEFASQQATAVISPVLRHITRITKVGFMLSVKLTTNTYNESYRCNRNKAVAGKYPHLYVDFSKLQISEGEKKSPVNASAEFNGSLICFNWEDEKSSSFEYHTDQLLLMAYCPEPRVTLGMIGGQLRKQGFGQLEVMRFHKPYILHTYIAFISEQRDQISDSVYAGRVLIPAKKSSPPA